MYGNYSVYFNNYVQEILKRYKTYQPLYLTTLIGFTQTASERTTVFSPQVDSDAILFGGNVNFNNPNVTVRITDTGSGYAWNVLQAAAGASTTGTPVTALFGVQTEAMPVLALTCPYFLGRQARLQMDFVNSATSPSASTATVTWVGIKLLSV